MSTTAHHRTLARALAHDLRWRAAAYHMRQAIALYPGAPHKAGTLAGADIALMTAKANAWDAIADDQQLPAYMDEWASDGHTLVDPEF